MVSWAVPAACRTWPWAGRHAQARLVVVSRLRMIGGGQQTGSSFATPLVSSLAAHTFANLRDPTPDLVRALLVNATELEGHDAALGWGTPWPGHFPWTCGPGSVTLAWRATMRPGFNYYWRDIPIPPEMVKAGKLAGRGNSRRSSTRSSRRMEGQTTSPPLQVALQ